MRKAFYSKAVFVTLLLGLAQPALAAKKVDWPDLVDPKAARFKNPFEALPLPQLRTLGEVYRLRKELASNTLDADTRAQLQDQLSRDEAKLAASGVDTDGLLSQMASVAQKRAKAIMAGNEALNGQEVVIPGYVIPVQDKNGKTASSGYLVPEAGMCSHMPPPDPNQTIRYTLATDWQPEAVYEPVELTGQLSIHPTKQNIELLDGQVDMVAVFDLKVTGVRPRSEAQEGAKGRSFLSFFGRKRAGNP